MSGCDITSTPSRHKGRLAMRSNQLAFAGALLLLLLLLTALYPPAPVALLMPAAV
jgi:hypothetical protein